MNRNEAYKAMMEGCKITHDDWAEGEYAFYSSDGEFVFCSDVGCEELNDGTNHLAGYKLYARKMAKVKYYQGYFKNPDNYTLEVPDSYFKSLNDLEIYILSEKNANNIKVFGLNEEIWIEVME